MSTFRKQLPLILLNFLAVLVLSPYLFGYVGITPHVGTNDLTDTQIPFRALLQRSLQQGTLPIWTPYISAGFPFLAEGQAGVLHPINLIISLVQLPAYISVSVSTLIAYIISTTGMFTFLLHYFKTRNTNNTANQFLAFFGSIIWTYCGFNLNHIAHLNVLNVVCWLPWQLLLADKLIIRTNNSKSTVYILLLLSVIIMVQALSGHPQFFAYSLIFLTLYFLINQLLLIQQNGYRVFLNTTLIYFLAIILGLSMGAVQLLPTYEFTQNSTRASGLNEEAINFLSFRYKDLPTLIDPFYDYNPEPRSTQRLLDIGWPFDERYSYIGLLPLVLTLISLTLIFSDRRALVLGLLGILFLLLSFGQQSPIGFLLQLPPLNLFRIPVKFTLFFQLSAAFLSVYALNKLLYNIKSSSIQNIIIITFIVLTLVDTVPKLFRLYPLVKANWWYSDPLTVKEYQTRVQKEGITTELTPYEARIIGQNYNKLLLKQYLNSPPNLWRDRQIDLFKNNRELVPAVNMLYYSVPLLTNAVNSMGIKTRWYSDIEERLFFSNNYDTDYIKLIDLTGAKFFIHQTEPFLDKYLPLSTTKFTTGQDQITLYQIPKSTNFLSIPIKFKFVSSQKTFESVLDQEFSPQTDLVLAANGSKTTAFRDQASGKIINFSLSSPQHLQIKITADDSLYVFIRQAYFPGWYAYIDKNIPAPVERANHAFQAVRIPKGTHQLDLIYSPDSIKTASYLTTISITIWMVLLGGLLTYYKLKNPLKRTTGPSGRK